VFTRLAPILASTHDVSILEREPAEPNTSPYESLADPRNTDGSRNLAIALDKRVVRDEVLAIAAADEPSPWRADERGRRDRRRPWTKTPVSLNIGVCLATQRTERASDTRREEARSDTTRNNDTCGIIARGEREMCRNLVRPAFLEVVAKEAVDAVLKLLA
jgi:hypothetical protein